MESDAAKIARDIWNEFAIGDSMTVVGWSRPGTELGFSVLEEIKKWDVRDNKNPSGKRRFVYPFNTVGGPIKQKIFRWQRTIFEDQIRYQIWRIQ